MKIAVITGASSGIGREFSRQIPRLYKSLDEIWILARRTERLKKLEKELKVPVRILTAILPEIISMTESRKSWRECSRISVCL